MEAEGRNGAECNEEVVSAVQVRLHKSLVVQCLRVEVEGRTETRESAGILTVSHFLNRQGDLAQEAEKHENRHTESWRKGNGKGLGREDRYLCSRRHDKGDHGHLKRIALRGQK